MIERHYGVHFFSSGGALTLPTSSVTDSEAKDGTNGPFKKFHSKSGWTIVACTTCDYYAWVNDFEAYHWTYGKIEGNFETTVKAKSDKALNHFMKYHPPEEWDYQDI